MHRGLTMGVSMKSSRFNVKLISLDVNTIIFGGCFGLNFVNCAQDFARSTLVADGAAGGGSADVAVKPMKIRL